MTAAALKRLATLAVLALGALSCSEPAGIHVDVTLGTYANAGRTLTVVLHSDRGFKDLGAMAPDMGAATATTEEFDGDDSPDVVVKFLGPFPEKRSFLVKMGTSPEVTVWAEALVYDATKIIGRGSTAKQTLAAGGRLTLDLQIGEPPADAPPVGPMTRDTDLASDQPKVTTVRGLAMKSGPASAAACDVNGDGKKDLVIGVPNATARTVDEGAGAVFVVIAPFASNDLKLSSGDPTQFVFFGATSGAHLGTAVACANLNGDTFEDFVVGAPDAEGSGRVYGFTGRQAFATTKKGPDVTWGPATTKIAKFGSVLLAANFDGDATPDDARTEIVVSAPGSTLDAVKPVVHVLRPAVSPTLIDVNQPDHPTMTGALAAALAAGDLDGPGTGIDLVLGVPTFKVAGDTDGSGAVVMFANVDLALNAQLDGTLADKTTGYTTRMVGEADTQFGKAVLAMNTYGDGADLYVGAPTAGPDKRGLVYAFKHDDGFFPDGGTRNFDPSKTPKLDAGDKGAHFGSSLAVCASGNAGAPIYSVAVGGPDATRVDGRNGVGGAYLWSGMGAAPFVFPLVERMYGAAPGDHLGTAIACGQLIGVDAPTDDRADLVGLSPYADATVGALYVRASR